MIPPPLRVVFALTAALSVAVAAPLYALGAQKYLHPQFSELTKSHKKVAILPFIVKIDLKHLPKNTTVETVQQSARDEELEFQRQLYSRLLQKSESEGYTVGFQDVDQTNALLLKAGFPLDSLSAHTKDELATVLGVDAMVSGSVHQTQPTSTGVAIAQTLLVGFSGSTQRVDINMSIHNGADGQLLWSYDHNDKGGLMNTVEGMVKSLLKKVAGNFPYRKEK
jgi:hypothetical protein